MDYRIISYDVWGNKTNGYEVNAAHYTSLYIDINENDTTAQIIKKLKDVGYLNINLKNSKYSTQGDFEYSLYIERTNDLYPVCELRPAGK